MKRVAAWMLSLVMLLSLMPTAMAKETVPTGTVVQAEEVADTDAQRLETLTPADTYAADEMVTFIVEMESAPLLDAYAMEAYASDGLTAGEAVAEFLASDAAAAATAVLLEEQNDIFYAIAAQQPATMALDSTAVTAELTGQWTALFNGMAIRAPYGMRESICAAEGVKNAYVQHTYSVPEEPETDAGTAGYSYDMVGLAEAWGEGYTGKGMLVAVLDTGLDMEYSSWWSDKENANVTGLRRVHEAFRDDSFYSEDITDSLRYTKASIVSAIENTLDLNAETLSKASAEAMYKTRKVPFAFDYAGTVDSYTGEVTDGDVNVRNVNSDHGTHVSGTVAGYAKTAEGEVIFSGVAPDAQLMMFKVFPDDTSYGATESIILNALEDAMALGADVVNLSLGSDNGYAYDDTAINGVYARLEQAGIILMTSAGNSDNAASLSSQRDGLNLASDPDISVISSPAVYASNLAVASINSTVEARSLLTWSDGETSYEASYTDPYEVAMKTKFPEGSTNYVIYDAGYGTYSDYSNAYFSTGYNGGVTGIALVKRGSADGSALSFADKINNAMSFSGTDWRGESYGVVAVIIYDDDPEGTELINMSADNTALTSAFISGKDGAAIIAAINAGKTVTLTGVKAQDEIVDWESAGELSEFTSWGAGAALELKPEITAPGGNIWSTVNDTTYKEGAGIYSDYTGAYGMMSGTSMAAPHMTGLAAVVKQYVQEKHPQGSSAANADLTNQLLVSTAIPQEEDGVYVSPRRQGAGLVNVAAAIKTPAYISVDDQLVGKLELGDDVNWTGSYDLKFNVNNLTNEAVTYTAAVTLLRPDTKDVDGKTMVLASDVVIGTYDLGSVTVPANGSTAVSKTVSLTEAQIAELKALFPNGTYVEGFITLTSEGQPQIGLPLLAFLGDWTAAPIFDKANWFDEPEDGESVLNNDHTLGVTVIGATIENNGETVNFLNLGQNVFESNVLSGGSQSVYHQENFTISPNGDGYLDKINDFELYQLRDARLIVTEVRDSETDELYFRDFNTYMSRSPYQSGYGVVMPWSLYYFTNPWTGTDLDGNLLPSGTQCYYTITAYGDGEYALDEDGNTAFESYVDGKEPTFNGHAMDKTGDVITFDVLVDYEAPKLQNNAVTFYEEDGRTYMTGTVYDGDGSIASVAVYAQVSRSYGNTTEYMWDRYSPFMDETIYDADAHTYTFTCDVTEYTGYYGTWTGNVLLSCGDYGANDRSYAIKADASEGLVISQTSALLHPGESFDLSVNNNTGDLNTTITRTSSNPEVATIDEYGHVVAIAEGQTTITVSDGIHSAICVVAVEAYSTEVIDFDLAIESFEGLKAGGSFTVQVVNLQPADVVIEENTWLVYEDDEDWAGTVGVYKDSQTGLSGRVELNYSYSYDLIPSGTGHLDVTINGVTRTMTFSWEDIYTSYSQDDLKSDAYYGEQTQYVTMGDTATLIAAYRQNNHSFAEVKLWTAEGYSAYSTYPTDEATGLVLDGPAYFTYGSSWTGKLVNTEGYELPESITVTMRYDYGSYVYESPLTQGSSYNGYTYDPETGVITTSTLYSSSAPLVIRADGVESEGNPAGALSGETYETPDGYYGPFEWTLTDGEGELETFENESINYTTKNGAYYTPSEPGVSYITASNKSGEYSVNFAVVCLPVQAETLTLDENRLTLKQGETETLTATLDPEPTLDADKKLIWNSFNEDVATVDENGVVTAVAPGNAYIQVKTAADTEVRSYCIVTVLPGETTPDPTPTPTPTPLPRPNPGPAPKPTVPDDSGEDTAPDTTPAKQLPFVDVEKNSWYEEYVAYVYENGLMNGVSDTRFAPDDALTRAMLWTILARMDGVDTTGGAVWYEKGRSWAVENGISDGTMPESNITREQVVTMLYRYANAPAVTGDHLSAFADGAQVSDWARDAMNWAVSIGLIKGNESSCLNPAGTATRAEIAAMITRFAER